MSEKTGETQLIKSLSAAVDVAVAELLALSNLNKSDISLQDAKIGPSGANGDLAGEGPKGESVLVPEDAKKADKEDEKHEDEEEDKKKFADKEHKHDIECKVTKAEDKKDKEDDKDEDDEMDDEKVAKMESKIAAYKASKAAKPVMQKSEADIAAVVESLKKSILMPVEEFQKSMSDRLATIEGLVKQIGSAPAPRQSVSGLTPLVKSAEDAQSAESSLNKADVLNKLFDLQKSGDKRVDSSVITRVEIGDLAVLAERDIKLT
jgi:hypothetical protein